MLFDDTCEVLHDRVKLGDIKHKKVTDRGCTALLDAIGGAIHHIANIHKYARPEDVPEHTFFVITTDGMVNASTRYDSDAVKRMVEKAPVNTGAFALVKRSSQRRGLHISRPGRS